MAATVRATRAAARRGKAAAAVAVAPPPVMAPMEIEDTTDEYARMPRPTVDQLGQALELKFLSVPALPQPVPLDDEGKQLMQQNRVRWTDGHPYECEICDKKRDPYHNSITCCHGHGPFHVTCAQNAIRQMMPANIDLDCPRCKGRQCPRCIPPAPRQCVDCHSELLACLQRATTDAQGKRMINTDVCWDCGTKRRQGAMALRCDCCQLVFTCATCVTRCTSHTPSHRLCKSCAPHAADCQVGASRRQQLANDAAAVPPAAPPAVPPSPIMPTLFTGEAEQSRQRTVTAAKLQHLQALPAPAPSQSGWERKWAELRHGQICRVCNQPRDPFEPSAACVHGHTPMHRDCVDKLAGLRSAKGIAPFCAACGGGQCLECNARPPVRRCAGRCESVLHPCAERATVTPLGQRTLLEPTTCGVCYDPAKRPCECCGIVVLCAKDALRCGSHRTKRAGKAVVCTDCYDSTLNMCKRAADDYRQKHMPPPEAEPMDEEVAAAPMEAEVAVAVPKRPLPSAAAPPAAPKRSRQLTTIGALNAQRPAVGALHRAPRSVPRPLDLQSCLPFVDAAISALGYHMSPDVQPRRRARVPMTTRAGDDAAAAAAPVPAVRPAPPPLPRVRLPDTSAPNQEEAFANEAAAALIVRQRDIDEAEADRARTSMLMTAAANAMKAAIAKYGEGSLEARDAKGAHERAHTAWRMARHEQRRLLRLQLCAEHGVEADIDNDADLDTPQFNETLSTRTEKKRVEDDAAARAEDAKRESKELADIALAQTRYEAALQEYRDERKRDLERRQVEGKDASAAQQVGLLETAARAARRDLRFLTRQRKCRLAGVAFFTTDRDMDDQQFEATLQAREAARQRALRRAHDNTLDLTLE